MSATYIIGFGGTGMKIGHALKRIVKNNQIRDEIKFRFFESDENELNNFILPIVKNDQSLIDHTSISWLTNFNANIYSLHQTGTNTRRTSDFTFWIDDEVTKKSIPIKYGLKGERPLGRIVSFNFNVSIESTIAQDIDALKKYMQNKGLATTVDVYIICSICGGTGSSNYYDVASILIKNGIHVDNIKAVFLHPDYYIAKKEKNSVEESRLKINSWAFYKELKFFFADDRPGAKKRMGEYYCKKSTMASQLGNTTTEFFPYGNSIIFNCKLSQGSTLTSDEDFYNHIAEMLYYHINAMSSTVINSTVFVNAIQDGNPEPQLNTMGFMTIKYPKEEFEEYFKIRAVYDVFKEYLLSENYDEGVNATNATTFVNNEIKVSYNKFLDASFNNIISKMPEMLSIKKPDDKTPFEVKIFNSYQDKIDDYEKQINDVIDSFSINTKNYYSLKDFEQEKLVQYKLVSSLHQAVNDYIAKYGFYAAVGTEKSPASGYVDYIEDYIYQLFDKKYEERVQLNTNIEKKKESLKQYIESAKKEKKWSKVPDTLYTGITEIKGLLNQKALLSMELSSYYLFSVGQIILSGKTNEFPKLPKTICSSLQEKINNDIIKYLKGMFIQGSSRDAHCITNEYLYKLPERFQEKSSSPFIIYVPESLDNNLDNSKWKAGSDIDSQYTNHIKPVLTLDNIFNNGNDYIGFDATANYNNWEQNPEIIKITNYIKQFISTNSVISSFINKNVVTIFNGLNDEVKNEIVQGITQMPIFVKTLNAATIGTKVANIKINASQDLRDFITQNLGINLISQDPDIADETKIVIVAYAGHIDFPNIEGNDDLEYHYNNRDITLHRPHIFAKWNESVNAIDTFSSGPVSVNNETFTAMDLFTLCLILDHIKKDISKHFVTNKRTILKNNYSDIPCIIINIASNKKLEIHNFDILDEDSTNKLGVVKEDISTTNFNLKKPEGFKNFIAEIDKHVSKNKQADFIRFFLDDSVKTSLIKDVLIPKKAEIDKMLIDFATSIDNYLKRKTNDSETKQLNVELITAQDKIIQLLDSFTD